MVVWWKSEEASRVFRPLVGRDEGWLCLDFDGTLSPIVNDPRQARLTPGMRDIISALARRCRVAIISGRRVEWLRDRVGLDDPLYVGVHGSEWYGNGRVTSRVSQEALFKLAGLRKKALSALAAGVLPSDVRLEDKNVSLAFHYRGSDDPEESRRRIFDLIGPLGIDGELAVVEGRMVVEVRAASATKGKALLEIIDTFKPGWVVYVGDDRSDAEAFQICRDLSERGIVTGMSVGVYSSEWPTDLPEPDVWVMGVDEMSAFLTAMLSALGG